MGEHPLTLLSGGLADATQAGSTMDAVRCTVVLSNYGTSTLKSLVMDGVDAGCKVDQLWPWQSINCTATR
jgi:hypothetical protein